MARPVKQSEPRYKTCKECNEFIIPTMYQLKKVDEGDKECNIPPMYQLTKIDEYDGECNEFIIPTRRMVGRCKCNSMLE